MSYESNMRFEVNPDAVISGIINGEIQARMCCKVKHQNNPEEYKKGLQKYREAGIVDSTPSIVSFMKKHSDVFRNPKLVSYKGGNIFEEMITLAPTMQGERSDERLKNRLAIGHELTDEETAGMSTFLQDFHSLGQAPDLQNIIEETRDYGNSIENLWRKNEQNLLGYIKGILGYEPEIVGNVSTYIMYPNYDTHRSCANSGKSTSLFFGKREANSEYQVLAHLTHQAVHQPMLPYKISMSQQDKEKFHGFIKFLTDKEIFSALSGESSLKITTPQENHELMGKIYPYWLGYRYRNAKREGVDPVKEIASVIKRDKEYYDSLPANSRARKNYSYYQFEKLDPEKIAEFFRYKKGMTPYDFIKIDFDNRDAVNRVEEKQIELKEPVR